MRKVHNPCWLIFILIWPTLFVSCGGEDIILGPTPQADVVLVGEITEKEIGGDLVLSGQLKNVGDKGAVYVQITFTLRDANRQILGTKSANVKGIKVTLKATGIETDTALLPSGVGTFELYTGIQADEIAEYDYKIEWKDFEFSLPV